MVGSEGPPAVHSERAAAKKVFVLPVHEYRFVGRGSFASHPPRRHAQDDSLETPLPEPHTLAATSVRFSASAMVFRVSMTVSGFREIESMPQSTRNAANSG